MWTQFSSNWSDLDKINWLERRILIASIVYYEMDDNLISDDKYEKLNSDLLELMGSVEFRISTYHYVFKDYTGDTGMHLKDALREDDRKYLVEEIIPRLLKAREKNPRCFD